jgi:hypothetical protein
MVNYNIRFQLAWALSAAGLLGACGGGGASSPAPAAPPAIPTVTLTALPQTVTAGNAATLEWSTTNATSCTASGAWSGSRPTAGSSPTGVLSTTSTFNLSCSGPGGTDQRSVTVTVTAPGPPGIALSGAPQPVLDGDRVTLNWTTTSATSCVASGGWSGTQPTAGSFTSAPLNADTTFSLECTGPGGLAQARYTATVVPRVLPTVTLTATPNTITAGTSVMLSWSTANATSCTASGAWSGARPVNGTVNTGPIAATSSYTLSCDNPAGTTQSTATVTVTGPNTAPIANAGPDLARRTGELVILSGAGSSDPGGSIAAYQWSQTTGPTVPIGSGRNQDLQFEAPLVTGDTVLSFQLVVTDNLGTVSAPDSVSVTVRPPLGGIVTIRGRVTYARVPFSTTLNAGLDYANTRLEPARGIAVQAITAGLGQVQAEATTDANGEFTMNVAGAADFRIRAVASMLRAAPGPLPHWDVQVRNGDRASGNLYAHDGAAFNSGAGTTADVEIPSGWDAAMRRPNGTRASAPFAILDTIYRAMEFVRIVAPGADFPPLTIDWSTSNTPGQTFYTRDLNGSRLSLSGQADADIDEFDAHTIAHEFGHYIEDRFSRSDSIGGAHTFGDRLDPRVAFGEGWGYAFAAMVLGDPQIRDALGAGQARELQFNIEEDVSLNQGWYSEGSVQEILWDLFDEANDGTDAVALGFAPLWSVMTNPQISTNALTSIFSFVTALKQQLPAQAGAVDAIVSDEATVSSTMDVFATTETNNAQSQDVLPVYTPIEVGGTALTVRSTDDFGTDNKLSNSRFLRFVPNSSSVRITATADAGRDPDVLVLRRGDVIAVGVTPANEDFTVRVTPGDTYVIETYDCGNAECGPQQPGDIDIRVAVTPN